MLSADVEEINFRLHFSISVDNKYIMYISKHSQSFL